MKCAPQTYYAMIRDYWRLRVKGEEQKGQASWEKAFQPRPRRKRRARHVYCLGKAFQAQGTRRTKVRGRREHGVFE